MRGPVRGAGLVRGCGGRPPTNDRLSPELKQRVPVKWKWSAPESPTTKSQPTSVPVEWVTCIKPPTSSSASVAIKLLPEAFARDAERVARFEREARVLADDGREISNVSRCASGMFTRQPPSRYRSWTGLRSRKGARCLTTCIP